MRLILPIAAVASFAFAGVALAGPKSVPLTAADQAIIAHAIKLALKDPESAKFKWPPFITTTEDGEDNIVYCPLVNSKNSFGGYDGYQQFIVAVIKERGKRTQAAVPPNIVDTSQRTIDQMCADAGY